LPFSFINQLMVSHLSRRIIMAVHSIIIHPSIYSTSSAQPTLPRVVSGNLRRHFLGAFGRCAGLWWAVIPFGGSVSTTARSDALAVAHLPLEHTSISRPLSIYGIDLGANWTNFQLPASRPPSLGS
ncbi:hypothetical protein QR685DRAFT_443687, partial [Neurospora intermedia]